MRHVLVVAALLALAVSFPAGATGRSEPPPSSYPSCGKYWNRNTPPTAAQRRANACILEARKSNRKARVAAAYSTIEGDPIVTYVFVRGRGVPVLVVVDSTRDRFGSRVWTQMRCKRMSASNGLLGFRDCTSVGRGKPSWLTPVELPGSG